LLAFPLIGPQLPQYLIHRGVGLSSLPHWLELHNSHAGSHQNHRDYDGEIYERETGRGLPPFSHFALAAFRRAKLNHWVKTSYVIGQ